MDFFKKQRLKFIYLVIIFLIAGIFYQDIKGPKNNASSKKNASQTVEDTVRFYNLALEKVFEKNKSSYLDNYADPMEKQRVELYYLGLVQEQKIHLKIKLLDIKFKKAKINKNKAEVATQETWENSYFKADNPDTQVGSKEKITYKMSYSLKKTKDNWLVSDVQILEEKKVE